MFELREAFNQGKCIIALVLEKAPNTWATKSLQEYCAFNEKMYVDISDVAGLSWGSDDGAVTEGMLVLLRERLSLLVGLLNRKGCVPSFDGESKEDTLTGIE
jgi:hypothetical protein